MASFEQLLTLAGQWQGEYRLRPMPSDPIHECPTRLAVTPVLNRTFLRIDQEWTWKDQPQSGSLLVGYLPKQDLVTIHWVDTWHNGRSAMSLVGRFNLTGKLVAHGTFPVDGGPDWGWRTELEMADGHLTINMFCVNPATNADEGWVRSTYMRV